MENVRLNNGVEMPLVGMGTWLLNGFKLALLVRQAVKLGYRSFDVAPAYSNEGWFGLGLKICGVRREELFITTKLGNYGQKSGNVRRAFKRSLRKLGIKYLDLYLMHWPVRDFFLSSWKQMEELYSEGIVRAIGVCNFHEHHLRVLLEAAKIVPAVNQIELHPLLSQTKLVEFCRGKGIAVEAYSPLARMYEGLIDREVLISIADEHGKTVPQIILRWTYQNGHVTIPKTSSVVRLKENISICDFSLSDEEMKKIDSLNIDFRVRYDPDNCEFTR